MAYMCSFKGKIEAKKASAWVRDAIECAGLVEHEGKSVWFPSLSTAWLGFDADLEQGCVSDVADHKGSHTSECTVYC